MVQRKAKLSEAQSTCAPLLRPLRVGPKIGGERCRKQTPRQASQPSAAPARARPEVGGERRRKQTSRPAAHPSAATSGPEVGGEGRRKRTPRPAECLSAAASGPGPKSGARGVESELPVQLSARPPHRLRARPEVGGERNPVQLRPSPPPPPDWARSRRRA